MSGFRQPELAREQMVLWVERLDDALPLDHPVRLLDELLDSDAFAKTFEEMAAQYVLNDGRPPYHPRDLTKLYLAGLLSGDRSSRRLEWACWNRLDVIWLMRRQRPDHATIAAFVTRHQATLRQLLRDAVRLGVQMGLVKMEGVSVDGTNIEADAGRGSLRSEEKIASHLGRLDEKIAALEAEWDKNERGEPPLFENAPPAGERPRDEQLASLRARQTKLKRALREIERRRSEASRACRAVASTTDPDSRCMKDKEGRIKPNYNAQLAVDHEAGMIVAAEVSDAAHDGGRLTPMLEQVRAHCGRLPSSAAADSAYNTGPELAELERLGVTGYLPDVRQSSDTAAGGSLNEAQRVAQDEALAAVRAGQVLSEAQWSALPKDASGRIRREAFIYEQASDTYRCPAGVSLPLLTTHSSQRSWGMAIRKRYGFTRAGGSGAAVRDATPDGATAQGASADDAMAHGTSADDATAQGAAADDAMAHGTAADDATAHGTAAPGRTTAARGRTTAAPCAACAHASLCCAAPAEGRRLERDQYEEYRERVRARMRTPQGRAAYQRRRETTEPRFGWIKSGLRVRRFMRRGLEKVRTEWSLIATAVDLSILLRHWDKVRLVI